MSHGIAAIVPLLLLGDLRPPGEYVADDTELDGDSLLYRFALRRADLELVLFAREDGTLMKYVQRTRVAPVREFPEIALTDAQREEVERAFVNAQPFRSEQVVQYEPLFDVPIAPFASR